MFHVQNVPDLTFFEALFLKIIPPIPMAIALKISLRFRSVPASRPLCRRSLKKELTYFCIVEHTHKNTLEPKDGQNPPAVNFLLRPSMSFLFFFPRKFTEAAGTFAPKHGNANERLFPLSAENNLGIKIQDARIVSFPRYLLLQSLSLSLFSRNYVTRVRNEFNHKLNRCFIALLVSSFSFLWNWKRRRSVAGRRKGICPVDRLINDNEITLRKRQQSAPLAPSVKERVVNDLTFYCIGNQPAG